MSQLISDYKRALKGFNRNVRLMLAYYVMNSIGNGVVSVLFNLYFLKLGLDENFLGSTVSIQSLVIALAGLPLGMMADRVPKHKMVKSAFIMMNVFFTAMLFTANPVVLLTLWTLNSLGLAVAAASEFAYNCENVAMESRTHLFSINTAVYTAGPAIGMAVGGYLPRLAGRVLSIDTEGAAAYRAAMLVAQGLFWLSGFAVMRLTAGKAVERREGRDLNLKFSRPAVVLGLAVNAGFVGLAISMFGPFMNVILNQRFGLETHQIGWLFTLQSALIAIGALVVPKVGQKRGNLVGFATLQVLTLPMYLLLGLAGNLPVFALAYILRGVIANMATPLSDSYMVSAVSPAERASVGAVLGLSRNLMYAMGGKVGGMFLSQKLYSLPIMLASLSFAVAVADILWMTRSPKTREDQVADFAVAAE